MSGDADPSVLAAPDVRRSPPTGRTRGTPETPDRCAARRPPRTSTAPSCSSACRSSPRRSRSRCSATPAARMELGPGDRARARLRRRSRACASTPAPATPCRRSSSFVPMLFLLPTRARPAARARSGWSSATCPTTLRGALHPGRALMLPGDAWHAVGPAAVLRRGRRDRSRPGATGRGTSLALGAQFAIDLDRLRGARAARARHPRPRPAARARVGLARRRAARAGRAAGRVRDGRATRTRSCSCCRSPLLLTLFARERNERLDQALELGGAYRGIAMLLGDLLEEADEYTGGDHTRGVVALSLEVAEELGLDERQRHNVELAALLHDIGKIVIPDTIINKPGPLNDDEWALMKTHTIEGQRMLDRVGGVLREVGMIVRASHERWDGGGYPDGLAGDAHPARGDRRRRLRRLQRDDDRPLLPPCSLDRGGARGAARLRRASVRAGRRRGASCASSSAACRTSRPPRRPRSGRRPRAGPPGARIGGLVEVGALVGEHRGERVAHRAATLQQRRAGLVSRAAARRGSPPAACSPSRPSTDSSPTVKHASESPRRGRQRASDQLAHPRSQQGGERQLVRRVLSA